MHYQMESLFSMTDLQMENMLYAYFNKAIEMLNKIGIETETIESISINEKATSFWGIARHNRINNTNRIEISIMLVRNAWKEEQFNVRYGFENKALMQTILHECLHCTEGGHNHGEHWKSLAKKVNSSYGFNISRTSDAEELGVDMNNVDAKYICECEHCHYRIPRNRMSRFIQHPEWYICTVCKNSGVEAHFKRIK